MEYCCKKFHYDYYYYYSGSISRLVVINIKSLYYYDKIENIKNAIVKNDNDYIIRKINKVSIKSLIDIIKYFIVVNNTHYFEYSINTGKINIDYDDNIFWKLAISHNSYDVINFLINLKIDVNICDNYAIIIAAHNNNMELFSLLMKNGADISNKHVQRIFIVQESQENLNFLAKNGIDLIKNSKNITLAVSLRNQKMVKYFIDLGYDILFNNNLLLRVAINSGDVEIVKLLLSNGANVNDLTIDDIVCVIRFHFIKMIPILIDAGYDFKILESLSSHGEISRITENMEILGVDFKNLFRILINH
ncbi:ankyrin repeat protein [Cotonvirus japonicus]|uniref:Ankyrin repeat protein n=1 Tax=Cotonvirus japonicus TaxID=2811091 RepID=A0ABM7NRC3_9VIRU|nr:ankyrin repeat protein [Cotonvirus japonicus]BCS82694.1 ankyrin repeat protein [Cotonvirus japonicus]